MGCPSIDQLKAFLAHELTPVQASNLERHSANCAFCRENLAVLKQRPPRIVPLVTPPKRRAAALSDLVARIKLSPRMLKSALLALLVGACAWGLASRAGSGDRVEQLERELRAAAETAATSERRKARIELLALAPQLAALSQQAAGLFPARPELIASYEAWLEQARRLGGARSRVADALADLRKGASPLELSANPDNPNLTPLERRLADKVAHMVQLEEQLARLSSWDLRRKTEQSIAKLRAEATAIERRLPRSETYSFRDWRTQWEHDALNDLAVLLAEFHAEGDGLIASIEQRLAFARTQTRSALEANGWSAARAQIRETPAYRGLLLPPQVGLVPLGPDPASQLWEFAHVQTGAVPQRAATSGTLRLDDESAIVFVLIPETSYVRGAQNSSATHPNFDPQAELDETVHRTHVAAFFISKFEMTQSQWRRLTGVDPSRYSRWSDRETSRVGSRHPVEQVSWFDCVDTLSRLGLALPSESQWELAARGGTTTPWWTGDSADGLAGLANFAEPLHSLGDLASAGSASRGDGFPLHVPVDTFPANGFGLHAVLGNVREWCLDPYGAEDDSTESIGSTPYRSARGGHYKQGPAEARSAKRSNYAPESFDEILGVRPARAIEL